MAAIVGLEGREMCQADGQKPGASGRISGARDGLWRTREAGG